MEKSKAIVVGATSGMGREVAIKLAKSDYRVGIIGRRGHLLTDLQEMHPESFISQQLDISNPEATKVLSKLTDKLGGLNLLILAAGYGKPYSQLKHDVTLKIVNTNVVGFTHVVDWCLDFFLKQGFGHLVSIGSIAGTRGCGVDPAYCAAKSFQSNYLEGMQHLINGNGSKVHISIALPGFVEKRDTDVESRFWIDSRKRATNQILKGIEKKKPVIYISRRWALVAGVLTFIPRGIYARLISGYSNNNHG
jgi:short-subunit dehydrogenase